MMSHKADQFVSGPSLPGPMSKHNLGLLQRACRGHCFFCKLHKAMHQRLYKSIWLRLSSAQKVERQREIAAEQEPTCFMGGNSTDSHSPPDARRLRLSSAKSCRIQSAVAKMHQAQFAGIVKTALHDGLLHRSQMQRAKAACSAVDMATRLQWPARQLWACHRKP